MIYNGIGYVASGGSYLANCAYSGLTGQLSTCTQASSFPSGDYEGMAIYNGYIYTSGVNGNVSWCKLNADGSINTGAGSCASITNITGARGMSIN